MKRTPFRRTRMRRTRKDPMVKLLDSLCRQVVFARDGNACVMTGETQNLQWCHVRSRRYQSTRWDPRNSLCLTAGRHLWAHHNPLQFMDWFQRMYPMRAKYLRLAASQVHKIDRKLIELSLRQTLKEMGVEA